MTVTEDPLIAGIPFTCPECQYPYDEDPRVAYVATERLRDDEPRNADGDVVRLAWPCCDWQVLAEAWRKSVHREVFDLAKATFTLDATDTEYAYCEDCSSWTEVTQHAIHGNGNSSYYKVGNSTDVGGSTTYHWVCGNCLDEYFYCDDCNEYGSAYNAYYCEPCCEAYCSSCYHNAHQHESEYNEDDDECYRMDASPRFQWLHDAYEACDDDYTHVDTYRFRKHDPVTSAADFYLMEWLRAIAPSGVVVEAADSLQAEIVEELAPVFSVYLDGALGGELRHASGSGYRGADRADVAWSVWPRVRSVLGLDALRKAEAHFRQDSWASGYGGEAWERVTRVLREYLEGRRTDRQFVDNVFSLQHNGGCVLDKVRWGGLGVSYITTVVGPAHSTDDIATLMRYSSNQARYIVRDSMRHINKARREHAMRLVTIPSTRDQYAYAA